MTQEQVKKAYESAEKELEQEQIQVIKDLVKGTLQKVKKIDDAIAEKKKELKELEEDKKILRMDLDDLKEGHLERIEERQAKDERAKKVSVFKVIKEEVVKEIHHYHHDDYRWYQPYTIKTTPWFGDNTVYCTTTNNHMKLQSTGDSTLNNVSGTFTVNNSIAKTNSVGAYEVDGVVINFR